MTRRYTTRSGSVYEVAESFDGTMIRQAHSGNGRYHRIAPEWKACERVSCHGVGYPLIVEWGTGLDERSREAGNWVLNPDVMRRTYSSQVVRVEEVP